MKGPHGPGLSARSLFVESMAFDIFYGLKIPESGKLIEPWVHVGKVVGSNLLKEYVSDLKKIKVQWVMELSTHH